MTVLLQEAIRFGIQPGLQNRFIFLILVKRKKKILLFLQVLVFLHWRTSRKKKSDVV